MASKSQKVILISTPELAGGSWISIHEFVRSFFTDFRSIVVTLGRPKETPKGMVVLGIPYPSYQRIGPRLGSNLMFVLFFKTPLFLMTTVASLIYRPRIIIGNGFITSIACIPIARIVSASILASFHGHIRYTIRPAGRRVVKSLCRFFDLVTVNSIGSREDASLVVDPTRIVVVEHTADDIFFQPLDRGNLRKEMGVEGEFVILYVGRMDAEKSFDVLLEVFRRLQAVDGIMLFIAGTGNMEDHVRILEKQTRNIRYFGYLTATDRLASLYKAADVVWSYADETYLARPAIEALASGTPIIIPDKPAILQKASAGIKIDKRLVPPEIGWLIDISDISSIVHLILSLENQRSILDRMRDQCSKYAKDRHSVKEKIALIESVIENQKIQPKATNNIHGC